MARYQTCFVNSGASFSSFPGDNVTNTNQTEDWRVLCELATKEKDPEKLIDLIMKINQALEDSRRKRHDPVDAHMFSGSLVPQLSRPARS